MVVFWEDLQGVFRKSQSSELSGCCAGPVAFVQSYGMQYESENPLRLDCSLTQLCQYKYIYLSQLIYLYWHICVRLQSNPSSFTHNGDDTPPRLKIHFLKSHLDFFPEIFGEVSDERWKISPRHFGYGKAVPRQVDLKYVCRLLLDTEEGCTWSQL